LRPADPDALARLDLADQARDRPIAPVGDRSFQKRRDDAQRRLALHRGWARRHAPLQRCNAAVGEIATPQANRVLAYDEGFPDAPAGPAQKRQQHRPRPIRLATIARTRQRSQRRTLPPIRRYWGFAHHAPPPRINAKTESHLPFVGYTRGICLAVAIKATDAIVMASDSRGTIGDPRGLTAVNDTQQKVFQFGACGLA